MGGGTGIYTSDGDNILNGGGANALYTIEGAVCYTLMGESTRSVHGG